MPLTIEQILDETRGWPIDRVDELVDRIRLARHGGVEPEIEASWSREIHRRIAEIRDGSVEGVPGEVVSARIRKIVGF